MQTSWGLDMAEVKGREEEILNFAIFYLAC